MATVLEMGVRMTKGLDIGVSCIGTGPVTTRKTTDIGDFKSWMIIMGGGQPGLGIGTVVRADLAGVGTDYRASPREI